MFQCCSLETSHPCLLPQSLKDCSIHLCLFFFFLQLIFFGPSKPHADLHELVYSMLGLVPGVLYRTLNPGSWAECCHVSTLCLILHLAQVEHLSIPGMFLQFLLVHIVRSSSCFDESSLFYPKWGQPRPVLLM